MSKRKLPVQTQREVHRETLDQTKKSTKAQRERERDRPRGNQRYQHPPGRVEARHKPASKRELVKPWSSPLPLIMRDIRQVDPSFTAKPALWVRQNCIVVSLERVRAIILHNRLFLFDPDNDQVKQPIEYIQQRLAFGSRNAEEAFMPFEFRALEGILIHSCISVERDFHKIEKNLLRILETLPTQSSTEYLELLRLEEQSLNYCDARIRKLQHVLQTVLDTDEDMANMYLTEKHKAPKIRRNPLDHEEAEMLLESYLQVVDDLTSRAGLLNRAIDDAENLMEIHLGTKQIQLLKITVKISMIAMLIAFGTAIFGIFGMNLPATEQMRDLPSSQYYFYGAVTLTVIAIGVAAVAVTKWCHRAGQGLYSKRRGPWSRLHGRILSPSKASERRPFVSGSDNLQHAPTLSDGSRPRVLDSFAQSKGKATQLQL